MVHKRTPLIVGNWKMNPQTLSMVVDLAKGVKKGLERVTDVSVVLAPPALYLPAVHRVQSGGREFTLAAQNVHEEKLGAHTGEISIPMFKNFDITHVIIGHSERRAAGESDADVAKKLEAVLKAGLTAIVCVGEKERDHGAEYFSHIETQLTIGCAGVPKAKLSKLVIAYEPIWAIGTGNTATPADAHEMRLFIQKVLADRYGRNAAAKVKILYGGSVNAKNTEELMREGTVDGLLVGGASLRADEFVSIVKASRVS